MTLRQAFFSLFLVNVASLCILPLRPSNAACNLAAQTCYSVPNCFPGTGCRAINPGSLYLDVTANHTKYVCSSSQEAGKQCDIDGANMNNLCASGISYTSGLNCQNGKNGTAYDYFTEALCAGSSPC